MILKTRKNRINYETWSQEELLRLKHNPHEKSFQNYRLGKKHAMDKALFLRGWIAPNRDDLIVEFGSSGGKTCIDLSLIFQCQTLGIDFDPEAIAVAETMRDRYYPELKDLVHFRQDDVTSMTFPKNTTKILMPDFTEHIPDTVFHQLLDNINQKAPGAEVFIYTPDRNHIFEILKHCGLILENPEGHINVKTAEDIATILKSHDFIITSQLWRPSHIPLWRGIEAVIGQLPGPGKFFRRRIAISAIKETYRLHP